MCTSCACARKYAPSPLSLLLPSPSHTHTHTHTRTPEKEKSNSRMNFVRHLRRKSLCFEGAATKMRRVHEQGERAQLPQTRSTWRRQLDRPFAQPLSSNLGYLHLSTCAMYAMFYRGIPRYAIAIGRSRERSVCRGLQC